MLIIDGDRVAYNAGWAMNKEEHPALFMVDNIMENIMNIYDDYIYKLYLTSRDYSNFRYHVAKTKEYKGTRKFKEKPIWLKEIRIYMMNRYGALEVFGKEADDQICIELYKFYKKNKVDSVIAISDDKDLRQCPGKHGDFKGNIILVDDNIGNLELVKTTGKYPRKKLKGTGSKFFYAQVITGDVCDEYPGMPKKGDVKAYEILNECATELELYQRTLAAFEGNEELMDEMATLAYMLREEDDSWMRRKAKVLGI